MRSMLGMLPVSLIAICGAMPLSHAAGPIHARGAHLPVQFEGRAAGAIRISDDSASVLFQLNGNAIQSTDIATGTRNGLHFVEEQIRNFVLNSDFSSSKILAVATQGRTFVSRFGDLNYLAKFSGTPVRGGLGFSPNAQILAAGVDAETLVVETATWNVLLRVPATGAPLFSPDGRFLLIQPSTAGAPAPLVDLSAMKIANNDVSGGQKIESLNFDGASQFVFFRLANDARQRLLVFSLSQMERAFDIGMAKGAIVPMPGRSEVALLGSDGWTIYDLNTMRAINGGPERAVNLSPSGESLVCADPAESRSYLFVSIKDPSLTSGLDFRSQPFMVLNMEQGQTRIFARAPSGEFQVFDVSGW